MRASATSGGSPGSGDAASFAGGDLLQYALTGSQPLVSPTLARAPDGALYFTHRRNLLADDMAYAVEISADLVTWSEGAATLFSQASSLEGVATLTWRIPPSLDPTRLVRLRVRLR